MLMLAPNNISLHRAVDRHPPSQDITLGCYYITQNPRTLKKDGRRQPLFADASEVEFAMAEARSKRMIGFVQEPRSRQQTILEILTST